MARVFGLLFANYFDFASPVFELQHGANRYSNLNIVYFGSYWPYQSGSCLFAFYANTCVALILRLRYDFDNFGNLSTAVLRSASNLKNHGAG